MSDTSRQLEVVQKLSSAIVQAADANDVYQLIVDELADALLVDRISLMIYDHEREGLVIAASKGMDNVDPSRIVVRMGEGISGKVFAQKKPLLVKDIRVDDTGVGKYKTKSLMSTPVVCSPLKMRDEPLGVINVTDRSDGKSFSDKDLSLLSMVADVAASYIHLTRLGLELRKSEKLRQELEIARNIQYRLLPARAPAVDGLDLSGRCLTAERVGGDYYDYFMRKKPTFVVADVSGHSIGAALIMAAFRAAIRSQLAGDEDLDKLVQQLNKVLYEDLFQAEQFVSMAIAEYIPSQRIVRYTTAGHPPMLLWRSGESRFEKLFTDDPLIGIEPIALYHRNQVVLGKGDVLVMYSDGVTEAANNNGNRFGLKAMEKIVMENSSESAAHIVEVLTSEVLGFSHPGPLRDDVTMLVLKVV